MRSIFSTVTSTLHGEFPTFSPPSLIPSSLPSCLPFCTVTLGLVHDYFRWGGVEWDEWRMVCLCIAYCTGLCCNCTALYLFNAPRIAYTGCKPCKDVGFSPAPHQRAENRSTSVCSWSCEGRVAHPIPSPILRSPVGSFFSFWFSCCCLRVYFFWGLLEILFEG